MYLKICLPSVRISFERLTREGLDVELLGAMTFLYNPTDESALIRECP